MPWVETHSLSFTARHDSGDTAFAESMLDRMEELRLRLEDRFDEVPGEVTIVVHTNPALLSMAHPYLPAARWSAAPAGRRYLAGWAMATELHVLNDLHMERRAAGEDSREALRGTAERLYAQLVIAANNPDLPPVLDAAALRPLSGLGLAGRGRRTVLRPPGRPLPGRGDSPPAGELPPLLPALAPRCGDPRRDDLRPAGDRARTRRLPAAGARAAPRRRRADPRSRLRGAQRRDRGGLARLSAGGGQAGRQPSAARLAAVASRDRHAS